MSEAPGFVSLIEKQILVDYRPFRSIMCRLSKMNKTESNRELFPSVRENLREKEKPWVSEEKYQAKQDVTKIVVLR